MTTGNCPMNAQTELELCPYEIDGCVLENEEIGPCLCVNPVSRPKPQREQEVDMRALAKFLYEHCGLNPDQAGDVATTILSEYQVRPKDAKPQTMISDLKIGRWLSAALEDPSVCAEMKTDINDWFAAQPQTAREVGLDWTISDESKRELEEIDRNIREAPMNIARLAAQPQREPVAWRILCTKSGSTGYLYTEQLPFHPGPGVNVRRDPEPLYEAPAAQPQTARELFNAATISSSGLDITIACDDHDTKDAIFDLLEAAALASPQCAPIPSEPTKEMALAGRKALAIVADRMEEAKLLATSSIDFWQRVGHEPANEIYKAMIEASAVMKSAERAQKEVESWSDAKRDYAERVTAPSTDTRPESETPL